jgi:hypothetical protein
MSRSPYRWEITPLTFGRSRLIWTNGIFVDHFW